MQELRKEAREERTELTVQARTRTKAVGNGPVFTPAVEKFMEDNAPENIPVASVPWPEFEEGQEHILSDSKGRTARFRIRRINSSALVLEPIVVAPFSCRSAIKHMVEQGGMVSMHPEMA